MCIIYIYTPTILTWHTLIIRHVDEKISKPAKFIQL